MFLNKQLFLAATCGRNGCPVLDKATERGRAQVARRRHQEDNPPRPKRTMFWRCGKSWDEEDAQMEERRNGDMPESECQSQDGDDGGTLRRDSGEPYRGTSPMGVKEGVSLGVDVSHLAPPARPVDAGIIDRASRGPDDFGGGDKSKESSRDREAEERHERNTDRDNETQQEDTKTREQEVREQQLKEERTAQPSDKVQVPGGVPKAPPSVFSSSGTRTLINSPRPVLDEAISWDRLDAQRESKKRKWWYMP
ncbi:hypothetical protein RHS03_09503, partial [Rhizoctonia solani]